MSEGPAEPGSCDARDLLQRAVFPRGKTGGNYRRGSPRSVGDEAKPREPEGEERKQWGTVKGAQSLPLLPVFMLLSAQGETRIAAASMVSKWVCEPSIQPTRPQKS